MRIALFCLEASRDDYGRKRFRFAFCVITWAATSATLPIAV
ncbi:MAG: hypothetical protein ACJ8R9_02535 [Steroidobacteraceae bacterium]